MEDTIIPETDYPRTMNTERPLLDVFKRSMLEFFVDRADKLFMDQNIGMKKYSAANALNDNASRNPVPDGWDSEEVNFEKKSEGLNCFVQGKHRSCTLMECTHSVSESSQDQLNGSTVSDDSISVLAEKYPFYSKGYSELPNLLNFLAVLVMKMLGLQLNVLVSLFTFPIWLSHISYKLMFPLRTLRQVKMYLMMKLWTISSFATSRASEKLMIQKRRVVRIGQGIFRSTCAFFVIVALLSSGFVLGSLVMGYLVEKPVHLSESLNFDYTKSSPIAFVPIMSYNIGPRVIPYNHKLGLIVSLTLLESEYNKKLGVFQVRVEFLSAKGEVTASSSYPCILRFKSQPIYYIETLLKSAPLIAGLQLESQTLNIKMTEFTEGLVPTSCLRVTLEPRAEYQGAGAGVPETYAASIELQSYLPRVKKIIWQWRRTLLVWISIYAFLIKLVFVLALCRVMHNHFKKAKDVSW